MPLYYHLSGAVAQLGEHCLCKAGVASSILVGSIGIGASSTGGARNDIENRGLLRVIEHLDRLSNRVVFADHVSPRVESLSINGVLEGIG